MTYTCDICGALIAAEKCLSCGHDQCSECPLYVPRKSREELEQLLQKIADTVSALPSITGLSPVARFEDIPLAIRDLQECYRSASRSRNGADLASENATLRKQAGPFTESEWNGRYTYMGPRSRETVNALLAERK